MKNNVFPLEGCFEIEQKGQIDLLILAFVLGKIRQWVVGILRRFDVKCLSNIEET